MYRFTDVVPGAADIILTSTNKWIGTVHKQALASEIPSGTLNRAQLPALFAETEDLKKCSCKKWHLAITCDANDPASHQQPINGRFGVRDLIFADLSTELFPKSHRRVANLLDREELGENARLSFSKREDAAAFLAENQPKRQVPNTWTRRVSRR
ncbi:hypothetical protein N24_0969 [Corynebacterium suranareeae]|uniref:Uncharacterized protein n=1 Tax=Corynebacterium suranareeae TaxID=2506452 RepID=A0A160PR39_9CORY|nr:hypothetical protein [Corynebacterium suranareeae]BAU95231.1 hypothetical protein N24_0969 [Corynebacterium suranareeae]